MTFAEKLELLTEDRVKSRLAKRVGLHATAISRYIDRGDIPSATTALRLARLLGVSLEWLIDEEQGLPPVAAGAAFREPAHAG